MSRVSGEWTIYRPSASLNGPVLHQPDSHFIVFLFDPDADDKFQRCDYHEVVDFQTVCVNFGLKTGSVLLYVFTEPFNEDDPSAVQQAALDIVINTNAIKTKPQSSLQAAGFVGNKSVLLIGK